MKLKLFNTLSFYPCSWCYAHPFPAPLSPNIGGFNLPGVGVRSIMESQ